MYKERVEKVENALVFPILFSSCGARLRKASKVLGKITTKKSEKRAEPERSEHQKILKIKKEKERNIENGR